MTAGIILSIIAMFTVTSAAAVLINQQASQLNRVAIKVRTKEQRR